MAYVLMALVWSFAPTVIVMAYIVPYSYCLYSYGRALIGLVICIHDSSLASRLVYDDLTLAELCIDMSIDMSIDVRVDMCTDVCIYVCTDMCIDTCVDMCIDVCADMCVDMCIDMIDMCTDMFTDMCIDIGIGMCMYRHVHRNAPRRRLG